MGRSGKINTRLAVLRSQHAEHAEMVAGSRLGVEDAEGVFAIFMNADTNSAEEYEVAGVHALRVADREVALRGVKRVVLVENPSTQEALSVIADPNVSSMAFIGHGSLGAFKTWDENEKRMGWLSWYHLLPEVGYLKTGTIEQRTCSRLDSFGRVRMPLGTFIVVDQTKIMTLPPDLRVATSMGFEDFNSELCRPFSSPESSLVELLGQTGHPVPNYLPATTE